MKKEYRKIASKNLPVRLPASQTLLIYLALDYWNAPEWALGVFFTVFGILWIVGIIVLMKSEEVDVIPKKEHETRVPKASFMERNN